MNQKNRIIVLAILSILVLALVATWNYLSNQTTTQDDLNLVKPPPTPALDPTVNAKFSERFPIDESYELNTGLTVERINTIVLEGIPTPPADYVAFLVLNHTKETIIFDDIGFGVQVYQYEAGEWEKVLLPYAPERKEKLLPPKTESFDYDLLNTWEFNANDLKNIDSNIIRISIRGLGRNSNKIYMAYLDLSLHR